MENVFVAPMGYQETDLNPFTSDGSYDRSWSVFIADPSVQGMLFQRKSPFGCYVMAVTPTYAHFQDLMSDILHYETAHDRKVIFVGDQSLLNGLRPIPKTLIRPYDSPYMVHSTLLSSYEQIKKDGFLKSLSRLTQEGLAVHPIGLAPLGEPVDYLDYIMFADGGLAPEIVVNSRLRGSPYYSINEPYQPQARMYFDAHKMTRDGIVTRNVCRMVLDSVSLERYLIRTVTAADLQLAEGQSFWTPLTFTQAADKLMGL